MPDSTIRYSCGCEWSNGAFFPCRRHRTIDTFGMSIDDAPGKPRVLTVRYPDDPLPTDADLPY
jgi:hypothetical protein